MNDQERIDYTNTAQTRVAADGRLLIRRAELAVPAGAGSVTLPSDVIEIRAISQGVSPLAELRQEDVFRSLSGGVEFTTPAHFIIRSSLFILPVPSVDTTILISYFARPAAFTSETEFEVPGHAERLVEFRVLADRLRDTRQDELADYYENVYLQEVSRARRARGRAVSDRVPHVAFDR